MKNSSTSISLGCIVTVTLALACAAPAPVKPVPMSTWNDTFSFSYNTPSKETHSPVNLTVAVVNPSYKERDSILNTSQNFMKVGSGFSESMATDMDKVLISKGLTITGPFQDFEEMTYPEKKGSDLALTPRIILTAVSNTTPWELGELSESSIFIMRRSFKTTIGGFIVFELREPLSNEKLWIKKLDLDPVVEEGEEVYEALANQFSPQGTPVSWKAGEPIFDGQVEATANALRKMYPIIMDKFTKYINTEELLTLQAKGKEIRDLKKY